MNLWLISQRNLRCSVHSTHRCGRLCQLTVLPPPFLYLKPGPESVSGRKTWTLAGSDVMNLMGSNMFFWLEFFKGVWVDSLGKNGGHNFHSETAIVGKNNTFVCLCFTTINHDCSELHSSMDSPLSICISSLH